MKCDRCLKPVNKRETQKILKQYGYTFDDLYKPICADCVKELFEEGLQLWILKDDIDDDEDDDRIPIEEAALYYLSSGDPEDTYGYTQEELEEYLKNG